MKKTRLLFSIMAIISVLPYMACAQTKSISDFRTLYAGIDTLQYINKLVYNGAVNPVWTDSVTFFYQTRDASGEKAYTVNIAAKTKTEMSKDSVDALRPRMPRRDYYGDWNGRTKPICEKSPDGRFEAFVRDNNVWLRDLSANSQGSKMPPSGSPVRGNETQISFDGTTADYYNMLYWSPNSKKIAAFRFQPVKERQIPLLESAPEDQIQPKLRWLDYAKPGDALSITRPALFDVESKTQISVDATPFENQFYLQIGRWSPNSDYYTFEFNQRGHQLYQLVAVDASNGKTRVVAEEASNTFVYYNMIYSHYMEDGRHIIWASERDDWRHLYMVDAYTSEIKQLTSGAWNVREILSVNEEGGYVLFYGNGKNAIEEKGGRPVGEDPYNKHLYKLDLKSLSLTDLTPEAANHIVTFDPTFTTFVDVYSKPDMPATSIVRDLSGATVMELQKADISALLKKGWTMPEVFVAKARDGKTDIWGTIFRPMNFNPKKKYPVVEYIYAGPHDSFVEKDFYAFLRFNKLMELGFIVVTIDGMGTDNRSKSFQDVCWRNLKDAGFPDRILWMKAAASKHKEMDISNVGIYGYSAGGQSTLAALLFFGDFYKVGVALCGCHDNRMDKIWWNEQWMGYPIGPWYSENSNVDNAWRLKGKLLIINGQMDDNVDPASSLQVVRALIKADKDFQQFYLPGYTHNLGDEWVSRQAFGYFYKTIILKQ